MLYPKGSFVNNLCSPILKVSSRPNGNVINLVRFDYNVRPSNPL